MTMIDDLLKEIEDLKHDNERLLTNLAIVENTVDVMDANHKSMATLLAYTGRERDSWKLQAELANKRADVLQEQLNDINSRGND